MERLSPAVRLLGIGFYIGLTIAVGTVAGTLLDGALDTGKLFTLVGLGLGIALALYGGVRQLMEVLDAINRGRAGSKKD